MLRGKKVVHVRFFKCTQLQENCLVYVVEIVLDKAAQSNVYSIL